MRLPAWIRSRQALLTDIRNLTGWRNQLALQLENASDENEALKQQLATARVEADAVKADRDTHRHNLANTRAELAVLKSGLALDQPFS